MAWKKTTFSSCQIYLSMDQNLSILLSGSNYLNPIACYVLLRHEMENKCSGFTSYQSNYQKGGTGNNRNSRQNEYYSSISTSCLKRNRAKEDSSRGFWTLPVEFEVAFFLLFFFSKKEVDVMSTIASLPNHLPCLFSKLASLLTKFQGLLETASTLQALDSLCPVTWQQRYKSSLPGSDQTTEPLEIRPWSNCVHIACLQSANWTKYRATPHCLELGDHRPLVVRQNSG